MGFIARLRQFALDCQLVARSAAPFAAPPPRQAVPLPSGAVVQLCPGGANTVGTGGQVWPSARALAGYLDTHRHLVEGKHVVELGSGCGLAGLAAAVGGARRVVLTDLPSVPAMAVDEEGMLMPAGTRGTGLLAQLEAARESTARAHPEAMARVGIRPLAWGDPAQIAEVLREAGSVDVILAADVLYDEYCWGPFLETVAALAAPSALVLLATSDRGDTAKFLTQAAAHAAAIPPGRPRPAAYHLQATLPDGATGTSVQLYRAQAA